MSLASERVGFGTDDEVFGGLGDLQALVEFGGEVA